MPKWNRPAVDAPLRDATSAVPEAAPPGGRPGCAVVPDEFAAPAARSRAGTSAVCRTRLVTIRSAVLPVTARRNRAAPKVNLRSALSAHGDIHRPDFVHAEFCDVSGIVTATPLGTVHRAPRKGLPPA